MIRDRFLDVNGYGTVDVHFDRVRHVFHYWVRYGFLDVNWDRFINVDGYGIIDGYLHGIVYDFLNRVGNVYLDWDFIRHRDRFLYWVGMRYGHFYRNGYGFLDGYGNVLVNFDWYGIVDVHFYRYGNVFRDRVRFRYVFGHFNYFFDRKMY